MSKICQSLSQWRLKFFIISGRVYFNSEIASLNPFSMKTKWKGSNSALIGFWVIRGHVWQPLEKIWKIVVEKWKLWAYRIVIILYTGARRSLSLDPTIHLRGYTDTYMYFDGCAEEQIGKFGLNLAGVTFGTFKVTQCLYVAISTDFILWICFTKC